MKTIIAIAIITSLQTAPPILSRTQAEDILGGEVYLETNTTKTEIGNTVTETSYLAVQGDPFSGQEVKLHLKKFTLPTDDKARQFIDVIWDHNASWDDTNKLIGYGDEAVHHSDDKNFYVVVIRKGKTIYSAKINKLTDRADIGMLLRILKSVLNP